MIIVKYFPKLRTVTNYAETNSDIWWLRIPEYFCIIDADKSH